MAKQKNYHSVGSAYHGDNIRQINEYLDTAINNLKSKKFDVVACTGVSGLLFGPTLAIKLEKDLLVIRKASDCDNHSGQDFEGSVFKNARVLLVDDLKESGDTLKRMCAMIRQVKNHCDEKMSLRIMGAYLYCGGQFISRPTLGDWRIL